MKVINNKNKIVISLFVALLIASFIVAIVVNSAFGYFSEESSDSVGVVLDVHALFGRLTTPYDVTADWGTDGNPYLIYNTNHLKNLYILQNDKDLETINENSVFQVSSVGGDPCYVGGTVSAPFEIFSIGSEDFPFISTFRGVVTTETAKFVTLPDGQKSDTSVLGNIKVLAYEGQFDIGLFGNVGRPDPNDPNENAEEIETTGYIGNLLLANIELASSSTGDLTETINHNGFFVSTHTKETNHIGILAGHVEYAKIENISVYYTRKTVGGKLEAEVNAFSILANTLATKYTTAGGILGYYKRIIVSGEDLPVNSDGVDIQGGMGAGFGLGVVYSGDIWEYLGYVYGAPLEEDAYILQETVDLNNLYADTVVLDGMQKTYFRIGVFTFVHSRQGLGDDQIAKLWDVQTTNIWEVSTNGSYSTTPSYEVVDSQARKYQTTQITNSNMNLANSGSGSSSRYYRPNTSPFAGNNYNNYRYMIVYENNGIQYALVKYGETASVQKIDTSNFIIPEDQLVYYTFRVANNRGNNAPNYNNNKVVGQTPDGRDRYKFSASAELRINALSGTTGYNQAESYNLQFLLYGKESTKNGIVVEEERPLRIYDSFSYMYSSTASWETIRMVVSGTGNNTGFRLQRTTDTTEHGYYLRFTLGDGYINTAQNNANQATYIKIYAVNVNPQSSGGSLNYNYEKEIYEPTASTQAYDMSEYVLFYNGQFNSNDDTLKYRYQMRKISDLEWPDNDDLPLSKIDHGLFMSDPSSSYYTGSTYYGILQKIPLAGTRTLYAPRGTIGFTVDNSSNSSSTNSTINVIMATNPYDLIDQRIEIIYYGTNASGAITGSRTLANTNTGAFVLPPVPGIRTNSVSRTIPIQVSFNGSSNYRKVYPNMNRLLVAYSITVTVPAKTNRTFFLEASKGSATFVYLSADKTASQLSNPNHKNDAYFAPLEGIDFVADKVSGSSTIIMSMTHNDYIQSLVEPFFGLEKNSALPPADAVLLKDAKNFDYNVLRYYNTSEETYYIYIKVTTRGPTSTYKQIIQSMNFNFYDATYYDPTTGKRAFSDKVILYINGEEVDWRTLLSP